MGFKSGIILLITFGSISGLHMREQGGQRNLAFHPVNDRNKDAVLQHLRPILRATRYVGRVYYSGSCHTEGLEFVAFPPVVLHPSQSNVALKAVREMFQGDANVQVTEGADKTISVTIGEPSTALLQTEISVLRIAPMAAYNPTVAIDAVEGAREVKAAIARLGLRVPLQPSAQLLAKPSPGLPHLPAVMKNVTVGQALDSVAGTFQGIVTYGTCAQPNGKGLVEIDFVGLGAIRK